MRAMKRRIFLKSALGAGAGLVGLSALSPLYASEPDEFKGPDVPDIDAVKVSEHCYYVPALGSHPTPENFGMFSNPGFVVTNEGVVVIDTGSSVQIGEMVLRQIRKVTSLPVVKVINTHYHGDHWLGNHAFVAENPKLALYAHPSCEKVLKNGQDKFWFDFMQSNTNNKITGTVITVPDKHFKGGEVFKLGGVEFKIHHFGRVHTQSDLAIEVTTDKTMYMGDMVMRRVANMADGSYRGSIKALSEIEKMPINHFIPMHGHHEAVQLIKDGRQFMETIYNKAGEYYEEGLSDFEMKPKIMAEPFMKKVASQWSGYESTIGKFIVIAIQEYEKSLF
ncbi:MAG: MBL fold metallo-hydrolase [Piscirickettsiaceae bacterium CG_4_9_14_3_um_filter_43_564]|nr:MBL fold metallo-hydrolase [Thiomicrospira sp.]OIP93750.1 MAG: MBL fold metallo-hydrolase [Thiomicrospira sp. CG2_30_44_34]PIQ06415.1 MAG: MBL fold metallo-hydrolase [Piscirickettsiaceae bacterium CG18_big_fil_WC_8_21_14_2_50_44_103]PIU37842.1 MAG: MBL fold metallo-hydrolase [Piscirickettsiaceae bacterium CG07_land_8_20_14_0_80_44_28]PIW57215.1 MAG: MBL fold metallo-hydrolase [Piscirickettsiaceae bacterium CG12_big_fil_rev_8_21_14_0_65_44_934]PIW77934.1 MAG: MBL fold metallo-hydrolase [Pisc